MLFNFLLITIVIPVQLYQFSCHASTDYRSQYFSGKAFYGHIKYTLRMPNPLRYTRFQIQQHANTKDASSIECKFILCIECAHCVLEEEPGPGVDHVLNEHVLTMLVNRPLVVFTCAHVKLTNKYANIWSQYTEAFFLTRARSLAFKHRFTRARVHKSLC